MVEITSRSIKITSLVGIGIMLLVLIAIGCYRLDQSSKLNAVRKSLQHTDDILVNLHSLSTTMQDAETGQRGFLITGNDAYLEPYNNALLRIDGLVRQLRELTVNSPDKDKSITTLEHTIAEKLAELKQTIKIRRTKGFDAAREEVNTDRGKNQMDIIRSTVTNMYADEYKFLLARENEEDARAKAAFAWLVVLCAVAIIFQVPMGLITLRFVERERLSTNKLREQAALLDLSRDAILVRDLDGTIRYWNRGAERMYGFRKEEATGKVSYNLLETKFPQSLEEIEKILLAAGYWEGESVYHTSDGRRIIVSSRHTLKTDPQGNPTGVLETNTDITAHKQSEQRQMALAEMKRENVELEQFASVTSHDLQEPLRAIAGCLQILERSHKDKLDKDAAELIHFAVDGAARMRTLITDLLSLASVSKSEAVLERTDLAEVLNLAIRNIEVAIKESNAVITHDSLPIIKAEKTLLVHLFQNLLSNAIKFCKDRRPEIHISATQEESMWKISVRDNGIGFEKEHAEKIFQPFKRLHERNKYPGTGIGLAICKKIVERHGGTIWADSEPGKGTTFYFTITDFEQES